MKRRYDLVILDFHGTQTDHALRTIRAYHVAAKKTFGTRFSKGFYQELLTRPLEVNGGVTHKTYIGDLLSGVSPYSRERFYKSFRQSMNNTFIPVPGMRETCRRLKRDGVALAVLTNGKNKADIAASLERWGLNFLVPHLYSPHETGAKKPDPEAIRYVMRQWEGVVSERTLVVGDYRGDIESARAVGADSALIMRVYSQEQIPVVEPRPTYIITDPRELLAVVDGRRDPETRTEVSVRPLLWHHEGGISRGIEQGLL